VTTHELLMTCRCAGIVLAAAGDYLDVDAPAGALTPDLRDELARHKADLLTLLAPVTEFVIFRGGLVVPLPAVYLALDLERRGCTMRLDEFQDIVVEPHSALTDADWPAIHRWRRQLAAILGYDADAQERRP
jgi:TubC N-terminal docking domain